jgi:hypothetical protein
VKKQFLVILFCLWVGFVITCASFFVNTNREPVPVTKETCGVLLSQMEKGFPLPYIFLKPSVTSCNSVEGISIILEGNAKHEERPLIFLVDVFIWTGLTALGVQGFRMLRRTTKTG